jgi:multidrug efflux pump subunit AcrB
VETRLPEGASVNRTREVAAGRVEAMLRGIPGVESVTSIVGYSILDGSQVERGLLSCHHGPSPSGRRPRLGLQCR